MPEVIIIGGGVVGCSIAYHLAKMGCRDVVVLEKDYIGSGSTEKCPGGIRQQFSSEINIKLSMESIKFFERFEDETGYPPDFRQHGYLMLATNEQELETFRQNMALQRKLGVEVHLLSSQEAREIVPQLNVDDVLGATYCPSDGYADPYSVVQGFASAAKRLGVRIYQETEVISMKVEGNQVRGVYTDKGNFESPIVVNAAGAYAGQIGKMVGINIPVRPSRRHIFVTEPLPHDTHAPPQFTVDSSQLAVPNPPTPNYQLSTINYHNCPMVVDFHNGFWFRREGSSFIFGMRNPEEPEGFNTWVDWDFLSNSLAQAASHRLPFLFDTGIMRGQAGLHADSPDYNAILGQVPDIDGLYLACGFSGHGFMHSPAMGRIMGELILNGKSSPDISPLGLERFKAQAYSKESVFI